MPGSKEEDFKRNIEVLIFVLYVTMPEHKNPCPRGHEIYNIATLWRCQSNVVQRVQHKVHWVQCKPRLWHGIKHEHDGKKVTNNQGTKRACFKFASQIKYTGQQS